MGSAAAPRTLILGCEGTRLGADERAFLREAKPCGFILFARNCETPDQVRGLIAELLDAGGALDALVLIDQEGGRVTRLGPPHWRRPPATGVFDTLAARDLAAARRAVYLNARLVAADLAALGINVDCYPVLDLRFPGASPVVGDRAFGAVASQVAELGRAGCAGLLDGGVLPVIKHMPGHGRAKADSHVALPVVTAARDELEASDFVPFRALADMPIGMTAHVRYDAIDPSHPATLSATLIREVIRGSIGFDGLLLCDDVSMAALVGSRAERARGALEAGCDIVLHCNGRLSEMQEVAAVVPPIAGAAARRLDAAKARLKPATALDHAAAKAELAQLVGASTIA